MPMRYWKLKDNAGPHEEKDGTVYTKGMVIPSERDLNLVHPNKFTEVFDAPAQLKTGPLPGEAAQPHNEGFIGSSHVEGTGGTNVIRGEEKDPKAAKKPGATIGDNAPKDDKGKGAKAKAAAGEEGAEGAAEEDAPDYGDDVSEKFDNVPDGFKVFHQGTNYTVVDKDGNVVSEEGTTTKKAVKELLDGFEGGE